MANETAPAPARPASNQQTADQSAVLNQTFLKILQAGCGGLVGLNLRGIIIGQTDNQFEEQDTRRIVNRRVFQVADGERVFKLTASDKKGPLPVIPNFTCVNVAVSYCAADKGNISVQGEISILG